MSRIIKSNAAHADHFNKKIIRLKPLSVQQDTETSLNEEDYSFTAEEMISAAQREAELIVNNAKNVAEQMQIELKQKQAEFEKDRLLLSEKAEQEGYLTGIEQGNTKAASDYKERIEEAVRTVEAAKKEYEQIVQNAEYTVLELGMKTAQKILALELENASQYVQLVRNVLKEVKDNKKIELHIHPSWYPEILSVKEELLMLFPSDVDFTIYPDEDLNKDGCIIESANGRLEASVDRQLLQIKEKLVQLLEEELT